MESSNNTLTLCRYFPSMDRFALFLVCCLTLGADFARAAPTDAREIARLNNCSPKKIEVYQQTVGPSAATVYRVECAAPKIVNAATGTPAPFLLVQCDGTLCTTLRSLPKSSPP